MSLLQKLKERKEEKQKGKRDRDGKGYPPNTKCFTCPCGTLWTFGKMTEIVCVDCGVNHYKFEEMA